MLDSFCRRVYESYGDRLWPMVLLPARSGRIGQGSGMGVIQHVRRFRYYVLLSTLGRHRTLPSSPGLKFVLGFQIG